MSKEYTEEKKEHVIKHKKRALSKLNALLEFFLEQPLPENEKDTNFLKKADLLSYWIETYCRFLKKELTFVPSRNKRYLRGEIIQVDLGFKIGREEGGLHYAVVLDKDNKVSSDVVTIMPLSSKKASTKSNKYLVDLGDEIYTKLNEKYLDKFNQSIKSVTVSPNPVIAGEKVTVEIEIDTEEADKIKAEINAMKKGSLALVSQITTVSKIRIVKPLKYTDPLAGIRLSDKSLDLIDKKICEFYIGNFQNEE